MTFIKRLITIATVVSLSGCAVTFGSMKPAVTTIANTTSKCHIYKLPDLGETPSPPKMTGPDNTRYLAEYADKLREYVSAVKRDVVVSYVRYVANCID